MTAGGADDIEKTPTTLFSLSVHLVFLNQYYPPDAAPTGVMLEAVVERLVEQGHQVTVLCAEGGYAGVGTSKTEHRTSNIERRIEGKAGSENVAGGSAPELSTLNSQPSTLSILRLPASRYGRGSFVGKLADYASYYVGAAWKLLLIHPRPDRVIALTTPPYLSVLARLFSKIRGADHAHWVMDLYPDVMVAHGMLAENCWKHRVLAKIARWGFGGRRCATILTLGPDMAERVERLNIGRQSEEQDSGLSATVAQSSGAQSSTRDHQLSIIRWVPLWGAGAEEDLAVASDPSSASIGGMPPLSRQLRKSRGWAEEDLVVMYSGNMGLGHRFGEFLEAAGGLNIDIPASNIERRSEDSCSGVSATVADSTSTASRLSVTRTRFAFFGAGKRRGEIESFIRDHPAALVELHDYAPAASLVEHLQSADVHLASLDAAWTGTMVPSKLQGIFAAGRPVIFVGSPESSIGRWISQSGGGWVIEPDDVVAMARALAEALDPEKREQRGRAAQEFGRMHFNKDVNSSRVAEIFTR